VVGSVPALRSMGGRKPPRRSETGTDTSQGGLAVCVTTC